MKQVIIIEPSTTFAKFVSRVMVRMGYETHHAANLESAFKIIARVQPDLVMTEVNVPHCSDAEICETLRRDPRLATIPIIVLSTDGSAARLEQAKKAGCTEYLTKPLTVRDIHQLMQRNIPYVRKRKMLRIDVGVDAVIRSNCQAIETRTKTLGEGGMLVHSDHHALQPGSRLNISLRLAPGEDPIEIPGEVIYIVNPASPRDLPGVGIKFADIDNGSAEHLRHYIELALSRDS